MSSQDNGDDLGKRALSREQVYLCVMTNVEPPPDGKPPRESLMHDHKTYLRDLERRGLLFGAGRLINEEEGEHAVIGHGLIVIRAKTRVEAEEIAFQEPFTKAGYRTMVLHPWQRNEGSVDISIRLMDSVLEIDSRTYDLVPRDGAVRT
tara:strand:+ start:1106 stop:1552 length:447 start_codon:yes stop_codon:yes gene_type:complete